MGVVQKRYFISSLKLGVVGVARAVRSHWLVEVVHWCLDVVFGADVCRVLDRVAAFNLNVLRKLVLNTLRLLVVGCRGVGSFL